MKRAFIATGPEASGTRMIADLLASAGATRDDEMTTGDEVIVLHRSVPHGGQLPDLAGLVNRLRGRGYENVQAVVIVREPFVTAQSQVQAGHVQDTEEAFRRMQQAHWFIFDQFHRCQVPHLLVTYAGLLMQPETLPRWITARLGLGEPGIEIVDGNAKYYENNKDV